MSRSVYDDSPARAHVSLTAEEVDALLLTDGSFIARDPRRVRHLLTRMRAAFAYHTEQVRHLQRDVEHMHAAARSRATPLSAALNALRQLSLEEQREVFDIRAQTLVDAVLTARADAERARTAARSETNRARFALATVLGDERVPAEVRARIQAALALVPPAQEPGHPAAPAPAPEVGGGFSVVPDGGAAPDPAQLSEALFGED